MASPRYTWNIEPEQPEEKHEMTPREKRANFLYYHKWHILLIGIAVAFIAMFIYDITTRVNPDYQIGVLSSTALPGSVLDTLETALTPLCDDRNGDGTVKLTVVGYTVGISEEDIADPNTQMADVTRLMGDFSTGQTMLFLVQDVQKYQEQFQLFSYNDGTTPAESEEIDYENLGVAWENSSVLSRLALGNVETLDGTSLGPVQDVMREFCLVKRVYNDTKIENDKDATQYYEKAVALFDRLTAPAAE